MAISAVDAEAADVVLMAGRDRLRVHDGTIRVVGGALHHLKKPEQREHKDHATEKCKPVEGICVRMKKLSHLPALVPAQISYGESLRDDCCCCGCTVDSEPPVA